MEQDYYLEPNTETDSNKSKNENETKKARDPHIAILALQAAICIIVLAVCLLIRFCFTGYYSKMKDWYQKNAAADTNVNEILKSKESEQNSSQAQESGIGGPLDEQGSLYLKNESFTMPVNGTVSSPFGCRSDPFTGKSAFHHGLDIAANEGTEISAALDGKVIIAASGNSDYGNYIVLDHGGFKTLYGHCNKFVVNVGQQVSAGETIALCGSTGRSTGPHLHFEVRVGSTRIDPRIFLKVK